MIQPCRARLLPRRDDAQADLGQLAGHDDLVGHAEISTPINLNPS